MSVRTDISGTLWPWNFECVIVYSSNWRFLRKTIRKKRKNNWRIFFSFIFFFFENFFQRWRPCESFLEKFLTFWSTTRIESRNDSKRLSKRFQKYQNSLPISGFRNVFKVFLQLTYTYTAKRSFVLPQLADLF